MNASDISNLCANLTLADIDDEELSVQLPNVSLEVPDGAEEFYAVGRLVTEKLVKFAYFQDTMAAVWRPAMGVNMQQLQPRKFLIRFYHETDIARVLNDGPWTYDQSLLVMKRVQPGEDPDSISLQHAEFWIQIHALPIGFRSEVVVSAIGSFIGTLIQMDDRNFDGSMRTFYRVRVSVDVTKPLKKQMKLKKENGSWAVIDFRYERLPTFCFLCGIIGHGDKFCLKLLHGVDLKAEKPYGAWLRANNRRAAPSAGQRWIPPESNADRKLWKAPGTEVNDDYGADHDSNKGKEPVHGSASGTMTTPTHANLNIPEVVIGEQKRRRVEDEGRVQLVAGNEMDVELSVPKNLEKAGLAVQTRLEL